MHASILLTCMSVVAAVGILSMFGIASDAFVNHGRLIGFWLATSFGLAPFCGLCFFTAHGASEKLLALALLVDFLTTADVLFLSPFSFTPVGYLIVLPGVAACVVAAVMHGRDLWFQL